MTTSGFGPKPEICDIIESNCFHSWENTCTQIHRRRAIRIQSTAYSQLTKAIRSPAHSPSTAEQYARMTTPSSKGYSVVAWRRKLGRKHKVVQWIDSCLFQFENIFVQDIFCRARAHLTCPEVDSCWNEHICRAPYP